MAEIAICWTNNGVKHHLYLYYLKIDTFIYICSITSLSEHLLSIGGCTMHSPKPSCPSEGVAGSCGSNTNKDQPFGEGTGQIAGTTRAEPATAGHIVLLPSTHVSASRSRYHLTDLLYDICFMPDTHKCRHTAIFELVVFNHGPQ